MKGLTSLHNEAALLDGTLANGAVSGAGIRDLLRDTALLVTTLAPGSHVDDVAGLRDHCKQLIEHFSNALECSGYPDDVRDDALIAQCGLLDETALRHLPTESRAGWEAEPLQVERFNMHDAGERVFDRLEARMRETSPQVDLLDCYSAILGMGFIGRYAFEGEAKRTALIAALNAQLEELRPSTAQLFIADHKGHRLANWLYRLSPWATAGLACAAAALVWLAWRTGLDMQLAHIASAKVIRP
jgi:type VI secretion system protein ImpK